MYASMPSEHGQDVLLCVGKSLEKKRTSPEFQEDVKVKAKQSEYHQNFNPYSSMAGAEDGHVPGAGKQAKSKRKSSSAWDRTRNLPVARLV